MENETYISFFEIAELIKKNIIKLIFFITFSLLLGVLYLFNTDKVYESRIILPINFIDYSETKETKEALFKLFTNEFYSKTRFLDWTLKSNQKQIKFDDFSLIFNDLGFIFKKDVEKNEIRFMNLTERNKVFTLVVNSNNYEKISAYFDYAKFINDYLTENLKGELLYKKKLTEEALSKSNLVQLNSEILFNSSNLERRLNYLKKYKLFEVVAPTKPKKIKPFNALIMTIAFIVGVISGFSYLLITNFFKNQSTISK